MRPLTLTVAALLVALVSCTKGRTEEASLAPAASTSAQSQAPPSEAKSEAVRSVYPLDAGVPEPLVSKLCVALHEMPEERRASCCSKKPGVVFTSECTRMLTAAVHLGAVRLVPSEVDQCVAAFEKAYDGCEWVGPWPPETPAECEGIVHGTLDSGARCRSSLECQAGMRCTGSGPTTPGRCGPPHKEGDSCGTAVDPLVAVTKEQRTGLAHPECTGYCDHLRCAAKVAVGSACRSAAQCEGGSCMAGKCAARVLAKVGETCPAGECEGAARCVLGTCAERKAAGNACTTDLECKGGCLKAEAGTSVCGRRCDVR